MLVLSRKVGEELVIAGCVRVKVTSVQGQRVRLAIAAPDEVSIFRAEIQRQRSDLAPELEPVAWVGE